MRRNIIIFVTAFLLANLQGISTAQTVENRDGVRIIHNEEKGIW